MFNKTGLPPDYVYHERLWNRWCHIGKVSILDKEERIWTKPQTLTPLPSLHRLPSNEWRVLTEGLSLRRRWRKREGFVYGDFVTERDILQPMGLRQYDGSVTSLWCVCLSLWVPQCQESTDSVVCTGTGRKSTKVGGTTYFLALTVDEVTRDNCGSRTLPIILLVMKYIWTFKTHPTIRFCVLTMS